MNWEQNMYNINNTEIGQSKQKNITNIFKKRREDMCFCCLIKGIIMSERWDHELVHLLDACPEEGNVKNN